MRHLHPTAAQWTPRAATARVAACSLLLLLALFAGGNAAAPDSSKLPPAAPRPIDFQKDVRPILAASCYECHGERKQKAGLRLDRKTDALHGGDDGPVIVPGDGAASLLVRNVAGIDPDTLMPPAGKGKRLTAEQVGVLRAWIDQGARWTAPEPVADAKDKSDHWAYKPIVRPVLPTVKDEAWVRTPIDRFILSRLEAQEMRPSPPAEKRDLLRRVYFDLTGLPPTPEDVAAFLADESPDAYERVVDRLLASPRYGERWTRHWLDVVHFAETHGNDQDRERPHAWPYRDYVIRSLNEDKPYARFLEEQVAGDMLYPEDPQSVVATGFLAAGPWDESSQLNIRDDTVDKRAAQNLDRDDMVTTTLSTFASTTVHCARCHDHKFDPVSQAEYYSLQSVFAGVDRADRPYDADPKTHARRRTLRAQRRGLETGRYEPGGSPRDETARAEVNEWERSLRERERQWTVLDPQTLASANGATLTRQPDGSIASGGTRPDKDTYTITAQIGVKDITAVRLELLTDDALPHHGPGRQDNGNLHLNEFRLSAAPTDAAAAAAKPVEFTAARADFDQDGWTSAMAIDGKPATAWGIFPAVGKPHAAVFELRRSLAADGPVLLTFTLEQSHGGGHLIGRFRLSVTNVKPPVPIGREPLPTDVAKALAAPASDRSDPQWLALATYVIRSRIDEQLKSLPPPQQVYAAAGDFPPQENFRPAKGSRPVFLLKHGEVTRPAAEPAMPGGLSCVPGLSPQFDLPDPTDEGARRAALAKWLSDPRNCLTWRSVVNRVWHYHFGRGLVATPNDFGHMGAAPSHPELLDWLASWFLDPLTGSASSPQTGSGQGGGGSLKQLHRLIVTSSAYRQSCRHDERYAAIDAGNQSLWRMNRTRLDAECVRDAVLQITGLLDPATGGPSAKQFIEKPGVHVTKVADYEGFDVDRPEARRPSIYRFLFRTVPDPFMDAMDCPDASQLAPVRNTSVTALQAMAMWNDRFIVRYSEHLAERATREAPGEAAAQVERLYQLCLCRVPTERESAAMSAYVKKHGLANACRVMLNSNEFLFVN